MSEQDNQAFLTKIQQTACCPKNWILEASFAKTLGLLAIRKSKWEAIRTHYSKNNISPIVDSLKGRVFSNHAIKFETVLHILTFIRNFSMQHGLSSPGNV
ncbi:hypothetical protein C2G38_2178638 [Gigaspora rosea]|uniref:Uncharacterized protein n=1 Tax=Gigaspora rosea TaxID=44941 RepID=A0A397VFX1_9GLOM|nr:hypothetical protein C2G38_2178638 [Gigaspora rosea]